MSMAFLKIRIIAKEPIDKVYESKQTYVQPNGERMSGKERV